MLTPESGLFWFLISELSMFNLTNYLPLLYKFLEDPEEASKMQVINI